MGCKIPLILMSAWIGLIFIGTMGVSAADDVHLGRKELISFDSISLEEVDNFTICDDTVPEATIMRGRIYAICDYTGKIRVFDSLTHRRLDDIVVNLTVGFHPNYIASCDNTTSLFIVGKNFDAALEIWKIDVSDGSQSIWMTMTNLSIDAFSMSPINCHLVIALWKVNEKNEVENTIFVYDQEKRLVRTVPVPSEIRYLKTVRETNSETYLIAEIYSVSSPYVLQHLDQNGQLLKTLRRDDAEHYDATYSISNPDYFAIDSQGFIYASRDAVIVFDPEITRDRVLISSVHSNTAKNILYDAYTDRLFIFHRFDTDIKVYAIRGRP